MAAFERVLGQDAAVGTLRRALVGGHLAHAYRFEGPEGVGKETTAFALAQALLCIQPNSPAEPCGNCRGCSRVIKFSNTPPVVPLHPDVILIQRGLYPAATIGRSTDEARDISVDQVRRLILEPLTFPPHEGTNRIIIVRDAHEMSTSAANCLLKTLEEPPAGTVFVLLTHRPGELLDTIRSRTQLIRFSALSSSILSDILARSGVDGDAAKSAIELANGSASAALLSADKELLAVRSAFVQSVLAAVEAPDMRAGIELAQKADKDRDEISASLLGLASHYSALSKREVAEQLRGVRSAESFSLVLRCINEIERNGSVGLGLESLLLRLRKLR